MLWAMIAMTNSQIFEGIAGFSVTSDSCGPPGHQRVDDEQADSASQNAEADQRTRAPL
jgi:hypothetical protein